MGHEQYLGTTVLRVRSLGYTGRDPGMARTSLLSQMRKLVSPHPDPSLSVYWRVIRAEGLLLHQRPPIEWFGHGIAALGVVMLRQVLEGGGKDVILLTAAHFINRESEFVEWLSVVVIAFVTVQARQVVEYSDYILLAVSVVADRGAVEPVPPADDPGG